MEENGQNRKHRRMWNVHNQWRIQKSLVGVCDGATSRAGMGGGVSLSPWGKGLCPLPRNFFQFSTSKWPVSVHYGCRWGMHPSMPPSGSATVHNKWRWVYQEGEWIIANNRFTWKDDRCVFRLASTWWHYLSSWNRSRCLIIQCWQWLWDMANCPTSVNLVCSTVLLPRCLWVTVAYVN